MKKSCLLLTLLLSCLCSNAQNSKNATLSGNINCYQGKGYLLLISETSDGIKYDTLNVDNKGNFKKEVALTEDSIYGVYTEFMGDHRGVYSVFLSPGKKSSVQINCSFDGETPNVPVFGGANKEESAFIWAKDKNEFCEEFSLQTAGKGSFAEFRTIVENKVNELRVMLAKCKNKDFVAENSIELDQMERNVPFRFCWGKRIAGEKMDADSDYVNYVNSFDLNNMDNIGVTEQILRWKMGCNPTDENNLIREMKLAKSLISNQEVVNSLVDEMMEGVLSVGGDPNLVEMFSTYKSITTNTAAVEELTPIYNSLTELGPGVMAMNFEMQDVNGNTVNFLDVIGQGKVTYIDFWATWCGPCCMEIPYLEKLVEKYKDNENLEFISVSLDAKVEKWHAKLDNDKPSWRQYIIPDNFNSDFAKKYNITAIPRFMVFGKDGKIIDISAMRPSSEEIDEYLGDCLSK